MLNLWQLNVCRVPVWWMVPPLLQWPRSRNVLQMEVLTINNVTWCNAIWLPTEHRGVHKNLFINACAFQDQIWTWKCWFLRRGKDRSTKRKNFQSEVENQHQTQSTYMYDMGSRNGTRDTLVVGTCSCHFTISAPQWISNQYFTE